MLSSLLLLQRIKNKVHIYTYRYLFINFSTYDSKTSDCTCQLLSNLANLFDSEVTFSVATIPLPFLEQSGSKNVVSFYRAANKTDFGDLLELKLTKLLLVIFHNPSIYFNETSIPRFLQSEINL